MTIFTSNCIGMPGNSKYPIPVHIENIEDVMQAVSHDYVCAKYIDSKRSNDNFIESNCIVMDCDNTHSDDPAGWVTPKDVSEAFPDVTFYVHFSRNNMKEKNGKAARPKFHVIFPTSAMITTKDVYSDLKADIHAHFPYFDSNALDAARFFYGTSDPEVELFQGYLDIDDFISDSNEDYSFERYDAEHHRGQMQKIETGSRNSQMSHYAGRFLVRYGNTEKAYECFLEKNEWCMPPLEENELDHIWKSAVNFYEKKVCNNPEYKDPEVYEETTLKPSDYSDMGQAKVVARKFSGELAFTDATDYLRFDGKRWAEGSQLAVGAIEELVDWQLAEAEESIKDAEKRLVKLKVGSDAIKARGKLLQKEINTQAKMKAYGDLMKADAYLHFVMKRRDIKYILSALQAAKPMLLKDISDFDANPFLLNCQNGTYDLRLGVNGLRPHDPEDRITKITSTSPSMEGMEIWMDALEQFFCGDQELMEYVQKTVGLAAIGKVYQEALIIAYGDGSNGKSTMWNSITQVLGDYSGAINADALTIGCKRNVAPEKAELKGRRLIIASELEEGQRLGTGIVKQLCSTDQVRAEKKYKAPFSFTPSHTLVLYTNYLPKVGSSDAGTWRRLLVIPFNAKIQGNKDIKNYTSYLVEKAGGAILTWIIEGAEKVIKEGFKISRPAAVIDAIEKYREENDWLGHFLDDCCEISKEYQEKSGLLYSEYRNYCTRTGEFIRSTTDFYNALDMASYSRRKTKKGAIITGLRIKSEFLS